MINHISIKDFAIIENCEVDFDDGLNIITGETGAGKSIVIEAISLALGARADSTFVRSGCDKAYIQMTADLDGEEYVLSREVSSSGKNLCKINGEIASLGELSSLCKKIADIHGQYDHQSLLNPDNHINLIDLYAADFLKDAKAKVVSDYAEWKQIRDRLALLIKNSQDKAKKIDFMKFELKEIRDAHLTPGEDDDLKERILMLQHSEQIYSNLSNAYEMISAASLGEASALLREICKYSSDFETLSAEVDDAYYKLEEAMNSIRSMKDGANYSEEELDTAISRLNTIENLKKKYGNDLADIIAYADKLEIELSEIENSDELMLELKAKYQEADQKLKDSSIILSELRKKYAAELCVKIQNEMHELSFQSADISAEFTKNLTPHDHYAYSENGIDKVELLISTNAGEPLKPLSKVASGGEMSRIMLAFKKILADYDGIPTLIFDEIDSGISGIAASIVGKKLREISKSHQILCITHLPQIAACGDTNYKISKSSTDERTYTTIAKLGENLKVAEIARLLGGTNITDTTLASARELIDSSK